MKINLMTIAFGAILMLSSCISVKYVQTGKSYPPQPKGCDVRIFISQVPEKYEELGIGEIAAGDIESQYKAIRKKACDVGANGVIPAGEKTQYMATTQSLQAFTVRKFIFIRTEPQN